jgi:uncharacterized protein YPO0396
MQSKAKLSANGAFIMLNIENLSQMKPEEIKAALEKMQAEAEKAKAALKKAKAEEKAAKEAAKAAEKALKSRKGEIDILADCMIEISKEKPAGWTRKELLKSYLAALGIEETDERAVLKEATLCAQTGARIQPRLEKLGFKLSRAASDMGKALYICIPCKG